MLMKSKMQPKSQISHTQALAPIQASVPNIDEGLTHRLAMTRGEKLLQMMWHVSCEKEEGKEHLSLESRHVIQKLGESLCFLSEQSL